MDWATENSREKVLECPIFMSLAFYMHQTHALPTYGSRNTQTRFHYTDAAGLLGIIQSGTLWATDVQYLNDPSEGKFFVERLISIMKHCAGVSKPKQEIINAIEIAINTKRGSLRSFSVSFCENGDLLSQWRGYGSFGRGYSIGFDLGVSDLHPGTAQFYDMNYGDANISDVAEDLLGIFMDASAKWGHQLVNEWATTIEFLGHSFKNESYKEEQESRIVVSREANSELRPYEAAVQYRARGGDIIPYIPLFLNLPSPDGIQSKLPIKSIIVGPGLDFDRNRSSIEDLLEAKGYKNIGIIRSSIPFRA